MDKLTIYQMALSQIGDRENIPDLSGDTNASFLAECDRWYQVALEETFRFTRWAFCRTFSALSLADTTNITNPNPNKFPFVYVYPDISRYVIQFFEDPARGVVTEDRLPKFQIGYEDTNPLPSGNTNWHMFSPWQFAQGTSAALTDMQISETIFPTYFADAVSAALAARIVTPILRNPKKTREYLALSSLVMSRAAVANNRMDYANSPEERAIDKYSAAAIYGV